MAKTKYAGSIVLGLNDALVEITGVLAGLTFAFQNSQTVLLAGIVTGIAASLSMAASEFLEARQDAQEGSTKKPIKSATYTGIAYLCVTFLLLTPYMFQLPPTNAISLTIIIAILIIAGFTRFVSAQRKQKWSKEFFTMAAISLGVALISFLIGNFINGKL